MTKRSMLILGDVIALAVITVIGFASHGELQPDRLPRILITWFPLVFSWFLVAPWLALFNPDITSILKYIWRVPLAAVLAAPVMGILRAAYCAQRLYRFLYW